MLKRSLRVAILGASDKPERYSYKALKKLLENGHEVFPIHQSLELIDEIPVFPSINLLPKPIDTLTVYVRPEILKHQLNQIEELNPSRVIMNPGTEDDEIAELIKSMGINVLKNCTLVLLSLNQF